MTYSSSTDSINTEIQKLTRRFNTLEIYYKRESESIRTQLEELQRRLNTEEYSGYVTAEENVVKPKPKVKKAKTNFNFFSVPPKDIELEKGVIVRVTNTYKGLYGLVGEVNRYTSTWVWFIDSTGTENRRIHDNVEIVAENVHEYNKNRRFRKLVIPRR